MTTNSIEGDGFIDKGWKQMWNAIPAGSNSPIRHADSRREDAFEKIQICCMLHARLTSRMQRGLTTVVRAAMWTGYHAVKKELQGYMVDGKVEKGNKSEKKAKSELGSYASILGAADAWPKKSPEAQQLGKEGRKYDKELDAYDNILSFPPAHPMHQKLPQTDTPRKDARIKSAIQQAEDQLHAVDNKLAAVSGASHAPATASRDEDRCKMCKEKWSSTAMQCAQDACDRKLWSSSLQRKQVELNNKLAAILDSCLPQQQVSSSLSSLGARAHMHVCAPAHTSTQTHTHAHLDTHTHTLARADAAVR